MSHSNHVGSFSRLALLVVLVVVGVAPAVGREKAKPTKAKPQGEQVEMFAAMKDGRIDVRFIASSAAKAKLLVTNKSDKPLAVRLPAAFAGAPVLAQWDMPDQEKAPQILGTGRQIPFPDIMQGPLNARGPNQGGPNNRFQDIFQDFQMNIAPEKVGKLSLKTVCLEHGKPNPNPRIKYEVRPIQSVTDKPGVAEICALVGCGKLDQRVGQLAAWHLNNGLSWKELGEFKKKRVLGRPPRYTKREIDAAKKAVEKVLAFIEKKKTPEKSTSKSQASR